jgi:hypothetical protein
MDKSNVLARNTDSKGRLTLGEAYANRTVIVKNRGDELIIQLARVIPEKEAWLYDNPEALTAVRRGLKQARSGRFAKKRPDLNAAARLAGKLEDS